MIQSENERKKNEYMEKWDRQNCDINDPMPLRTNDWTQNTHSTTGQKKKTYQGISTVISNDMIRIVCAVSLLHSFHSKHWLLFLHFYCRSDNFLQFFTNKTRPSVTLLLFLCEQRNEWERAYSCLPKGCN